jgi:hypothetical protein
MLMVTRRMLAAAVTVAIVLGLALVIAAFAYPPAREDVIGIGVMLGVFALIFLFLWATKRISSATQPGTVLSSSDAVMRELASALDLTFYPLTRRATAGQIDPSWLAGWLLSWLLALLVAKAVDSDDVEPPSLPGPSTRRPPADLPQHGCVRGTLQGFTVSVRVVRGAAYNGARIFEMEIEISAPGLTFVTGPDDVFGARARRLYYRDDAITLYPYVPESDRWGDLYMIRDVKVLRSLVEDLLGLAERQTARPARSAQRA